MTGARQYLRAFKNLCLYARICVRSSSFTYRHAQHSTHWTHCRHLTSFRQDHSLPTTTGLYRTNSNGFLTTSAQSVVIYTVRHKSKKTQKRNRTGPSQDEEDDDYDVEEVDPEASDYDDDEPVEDSTIPKDYKDIEKAVQSFRFDVILTAGLDMSRNKVEEEFYKGKLRLNGEKLWKKSRAVKVGDILDLIVEDSSENETTTVMRIVLKDVLKEKTSTDKYKVVLRRWKTLKVPRAVEAFRMTDKHTTDAEH
ncbi:mitochondrial transcription rescue factor 1 [Pseudophryne corroboree]|uniref:mitochondrial transcription rescue factor 1 n=1 Tax=Pseudophryne corroboree TaxID=495146 RepID=UPI0030817A33